MASSFWKVCGFSVHTKTGGLHPETRFQKSALFRRCVFRILVDGRPKRCNPCAFSQNSVLVWTAPNCTHSKTFYEVKEASPCNTTVQLCWSLHIICFSRFVLVNLNSKSKCKAFELYSFKLACTMSNSVCRAQSLCKVRYAKLRTFNQQLGEYKCWNGVCTRKELRWGSVPKTILACVMVYLCVGFYMCQCIVCQSREPRLPQTIRTRAPVASSSLRL